MESLRTALTWIKDLLDWLPDPVVALLILAIAVLVALALHRWARKLVRSTLAARYPYIFSTFTQTRGLSRLALLILAMIIAIPVAPLRPETAALLARLMGVAVIGLIGWAAIIALHIAADLYLRTAGPAFAFLGAGMALYFASQGAGRVLGPVLASTVRLAVIAIGGGLLTAAAAPLWTLFAVVALSMLAYGLTTATAVAITPWGRKQAG